MVISVARARFSKSVAVSSALIASSTSPTLSSAQINADSAKFLLDPLGTINSFAAAHSNSRVNATFLSNPAFDIFPEIDLLRSLAEPISPIFDPLFTPSIDFAETRQQLLEIEPVILSLFQANYSKGEVVVVTLDSFKQVALALPNQLALSNIWHTEKYQNDLGRLLYDYSNLSNHSPINSEVCRDAYRSEFGILSYPSLLNFAELFLQAERLFPDEQLFIAKSDVHRAYHRFRWSAVGSLLLALRINDFLVALPVTGGFGSNGPPFVYDPIRRFLNWLHRVRMALLSLPAIADIFVDDLAGFGPLRILLPELEAHEQAVNSLLGPGAAHRRELGTRLDIIGARFNTETKTIGISLKGYLKLVYLFFCILPQNISHSTRLPVRVIQSLAGVTMRYGSLIPLLRPSAYIFYNLLRDSQSIIRLSKHAVALVRLWRSYLHFAFMHPNALDSSIWEFAMSSRNLSSNSSCLSSMYCVYSDATLHSLGLFIDNLGWCHVPVPSFSSLEVSIAVLEFIAAILAFLFAIQLKASSHVHIYIDNQNAEAWSSGKFHTQSNVVVSFVYVNSCLQSMLGISQTRSYIKSEHNVNADNISRMRFDSFVNLQRYSLASPILTFLRNCLEQPAVCQFEILQQILTIPVSEGFYPF
jgi:hypothetical protein